MQRKLSIFGQKALLISLAVQLAVAALPAFAEAEEHAHGIMSLKFFWINFLIYVFGLYFLCRKPVARGWDARRAMITSAVEEAQREAAVARQLRLDAESKLAALPAETKKMSSDIEHETQRETTEILLHAKTRSARITAQATDLAEAERKATENLIRRELVSLAVKKAEERLQKEITPETDKALRSTALTSVPQLLQ
jgi:F0F1-type ATP synthase membrane subunit b/b'